MPRVAWWKGHVRGEDHKIPIFYTTTEGGFRMETPLVFHDAPFNADTIYGETEAKLREKMQKLIDQLVELKETKQKVIAYLFRASCEIYEEYDEFGDGVGNRVYVRHWGKYAHYGAPGDGTVLTIDYKVLWEYVSPIEKKPYYKEESRSFGEVREAHTSWPREYKRMVWTPEAEAFFKELQSMLRNAIRRVDEFIGEDPDALQLEIQRLAGRGLPFFEEDKK